MDHTFWVRMHGASTHFPIALVLVSMFCDLCGCFLPWESRRRELRTVGYYLIVLAAVSSFGAVLSGLVIGKWVIIGTGSIAKHHQFVWPAFALMIALAVWRVFVGDRATRRGFAVYLAVMVVTSALIAAAGYWGGEMLIGN